MDRKPLSTQCDKVGVNSGKFFCGRKGKYGLNLQGVCDVKDYLHTYQFNIQQQPLITFHLSHHRCTNNSPKDRAYLVVFAYMETTPMLMNPTCVFHFQTHHLA